MAISANRRKQAKNLQNDSDLSKQSIKDLIEPSLKESETFFKSPYWGLSYDFPWNPDPLCSGNNYSTYDEMREDEQIKACLSLKKDMVINSGWTIQTEDGNDEIIDFITDNLEQLGELQGNISFDAILRNILTSFDYGFSISEPVFELIEGKYHIKTVYTRAPHTFKIYVTDKGDIEKYTQSTNFAEININPDKVMHHVYQYDFNNPYGKSDLRSAYNAWKSKKFFNRMFAMYVERYANPIGIAKHPESYSAEQVEQLHKILKSMRTNAYLTVDEAVQIDFLEAGKDSSDIFLKGIDNYNLQISRSLLMPDLLGISGSQTSGGSFALGKEQFKLFLNVLKTARIALEAKITTKLVRPLTKLNFGDIPVWFQFNPWSLEDVKEYLKLWLQATGQDLYVPSDEEINYFRSTIGFPEGAVERVEPAVNPLNPLLNKGGEQNEDDKMLGEGKGQGKEVKDEGKEKTEETKEEEPKKDIENKNKGEAKEKEFANDINCFSYNRNFTRYEKKCDFELIQKQMDTGEQKTSRKVISACKEIYNGIIQDIIDGGLLTKLNPDKLNKIKPKYLKPLNLIIKDYFNSLFIQSYNTAQQEIFPNQKEKQFAIELLPEEFLEILDAESFSIVGDYTFNITKKARAIVTQGIKDGWSQSEIVKMLRGELENTTEVWTNTMLRTKTTEIYNEARKKYYETDKLAKDVVEAYQWSAILDDRTSEVCRELDQTIFPVDMSSSLKPPAHYNCRSLLIPITKYEDYKSDDNYSEDVNMEKLVKMGGGLLVPAKSGATMFDLQYERLSFGKIKESFGDEILITSPDKNKKINIISIFASNLDLEKPVTVAFKDSSEAEYRYSTMLNYGGGKLDKNFGNEFWTLNVGSDFIVTLSANVRTNIEIIYFISDINKVVTTDVINS